MKNISDIKKKIAAQMPFLREKFHVQEMGVFGSVARGDETAKSDIDILVSFNMPIGFFDFIRLEDFLSNLLGEKVDLVCKRALKPVIKDDVLKEVIYV